MTPTILPIRLRPGLRNTPTKKRRISCKILPSLKKAKLEWDRNLSVPLLAKPFLSHALYLAGA